MASAPRSRPPSRRAPSTTWTPRSAGSRWPRSRSPTPSRWSWPRCPTPAISSRSSTRRSTAFEPDAEEGRSPMPEVSMPRLSDTMEEGTIAKWLKQPGDKVEKGEVLAEIETDKAVMELESYDAGVLEQILVPEGETVPIGQAIATVGSGEGGGAAAGGPAPADTSGQSPAQSTPAAPSASPAPQAEEGAVREDEAPADKPLPDAGAAAGGNGAAAGEKVKASPLARAIAREHGLDLSGIAGSGPGGRIVREDVMAVVNSGGAKAAAAPAGAPAGQIDG